MFKSNVKQYTHTMTLLIVFFMSLLPVCSQMLIHPLILCTFTSQTYYVLFSCPPSTMKSLSIVIIVSGLSRCSRFMLLRAHSTSAALHQGVPGSVWKLGRLNHIAIAVPDIDKATALYRDVLGATVSGKVPLPEHGVYTVFVELSNTKLELLHPLGEKSPIAGFLQKNKAGGMHHICIEVRLLIISGNDVRPQAFGADCCC